MAIILKNQNLLSQTSFKKNLILLLSTLLIGESLILLGYIGNNARDLNPLLLYFSSYFPLFEEGLCLNFSVFLSLLATLLGLTGLYLFYCEKFPSIEKKETASKRPLTFIELFLRVFLSYVFYALSSFSYLFTLAFFISLFFMILNLKERDLSVQEKEIFSKKKSPKRLQEGLINLLLIGLLLFCIWFFFFLDNVLLKLYNSLRWSFNFTFLLKMIN